jgi:hypothetical protein
MKTPVCIKKRDAKKMDSGSSIENINKSNEPIERDETTVKF